MVLTYFNICVGITNLFVLLPVFGMFFCSHSCIRTYRHPRIVVSSLTYEKDCVRCFFIHCCEFGLVMLRELSHSITKVKQPVYFGASPSDWEIKCVSMRMKGRRNLYMGTICSCGTNAFEVSVFLRAGVWGYKKKKYIRFEACLDKEH